MRYRCLIGLSLMLAALAVPALTFAQTTTRPKVGRWKLSGGGFIVNGSATAVSGFHIVGSSCSLGKLTVLGTEKLRLATADGISNWVVGYGDPDRKNPNEISGVVPQRVKVRSAGKIINARLDIIFSVDANLRVNEGNLVINGCTLSFDAVP